MRTIYLFGCLALGLSLAGCGDAEPATPPANSATGIEIEGTWTSNFGGGTEVIDDDSWTTDFGSVAVTTYSNAENVAVTLNPDDAQYFPGKYNRIVWTELEGGSFYYCTTDYDQATEEEALEAATPADESDPDNTGCGGENPWTKLTRK